MNSIRFEAAQLTDIVAHARRDAPSECCGLIAGHAQHVKLVIPIRNAAQNPTVAYEMEASELLQGLKQIDTQRYELLGIYHSHPADSPLPSERDIRNARQNLPDVVYLIVSLRYPQAELQAWHICDERITKVDILVGQQEEAMHRPLSAAQRSAFVIAIVLAVLLLVSTAVYLLPPAPALPLAN